MELKVIRTEFTEHSTIGSLFIDGKFQCYTLEDKTRPVKIKKETAIPAGRYEIKLTWSPKYKRICPQIMDVPHFQGIRIHPGNDDKDTWGCLLLGKEKQKDKILNSRVAVKEFESIVIPYLEQGGKIFITLEGEVF